MTQNKQQQIDMLNSRVKVRLAPSKIHGVGVFAMRDIMKGEHLYANDVPFVYSLTYTDLDNLKPEIRQLLLEQWPQVINGSRFAFPTGHLQAYMNHSDKNNYDGKTDTTLRDIKEGEEITEDYRDIPGYQQIYPFLA